VRVSGDGTFELPLSKPGLYQVEFSGIDHYPLEAPIVVQEPGPVVLSTRLKAYKLRDPVVNVRIIGDFNDFSFNEDVVEMTKHEDGSYVATVEMKADTLAYQLIGAVGGRSVNGTQSDYYVYDGHGDYRSVVRTNSGPVTIVFDPRRFMQPSTEPSVSFQDDSSLAARFYQFHLNLQNRQEGFNEASLDLSDIMAMRESGTDPLLKNARFLAAIELGALEKDSTFGELVLDRILPTSLLWSYSPRSLALCIFKSGDRQKYIPYLRQTIDEHADREIKPSLIENLLYLGKAAGDSALVANYYQTLANEFGDSPWAQRAKTVFDPNRAVQPGKPVPHFSLTSLEDSTNVFSNSGFLGSIYLIDSWAVWCAPCVAEMKYLHAAYDQFKSKGLVILSVSFDIKPDDVARFRKGRWPMPWFHTFVTNGPQSEFAKAFEILAIPKAILVGRDGTIIAAGQELRGEKLLSVLSGVFQQ
jgi:thiol-disulfide isomerase/thioredoxin